MIPKHLSEIVTGRSLESPVNPVTHLMHYIRGMHKLPLILSANGSGILKWWVDASFAVHLNMRGHSGGGLSLGRGFPIVSKFRNMLMGVVPVKDPGTGKVKPQKSKLKVHKDKTREQKVSGLAPLPSKERRHRSVLEKVES
jgi:hypothetical protein